MNPAANRSIDEPNCQTVSRIKGHNASFSSPNHERFVMPIVARKVFTRPVEENNSFQTSVTATLPPISDGR